jgi:hypothetical protein
MHGIRKSSLFLVPALLTVVSLWGATPSGADGTGEGCSPAVWTLAGGRAPETLLAFSTTPPRMAPELALATFEQRAVRQLNEPVSYSADTVVDAELPGTAQRGEYRLRRRFIAPNTLLFTPVRFVGDNFVKNNVIARLLQAEVEHVSKREGAQTAISDANYKFSYKGVAEIDNNPVHVFHVKPRRKRPGLFKGRVYLDAGTGSLRRAEGTLVKTQSLFIKKIDFVQDYADLESYTFPVHARSVAETRLLGRALVEVAIDGYDLASTSDSAEIPTGGGSQ